MQHRMSYNESLPRGTAQFPVELYAVDARDPRFHMAYHWHLEFEIIRVLRGQFALVWDEQPVALPAGSIAMIYCGALHGGIPSPDCEYECLVFDPALLTKANFAGQTELQQLLNGAGRVPPIVQAAQPDIWARMTDLFAAAPRKTAGAPLRVRGLLLECFGLLLDSGCVISAADRTHVNRKIEQIKRVLARIERDYTENLTLTDLADEAGMSSKYFCHFFQQLTRRTPIDYLNDYRVEQACMLLQSGGCTVTDAAFRCGFNDLSYFIRIFRKYRGTSPGKYLQACRAAEDP